jgi:hypothetical protein
MHSPEPWKLHQRSERPGDVDVADANDQCVLETDWVPGELERADYERIVACVNACQGIPDINGTISMIADMKVAILTNDQELLEIVRKRLVELDTMKPLL